MIAFFLGALVILFSFNNNVEGFAHDRQSERMLNGESAKIVDFPFFAGLVNCGAAVLSDRWVVTAAHCVDEKQFSVGYVWVGGESFRNSKKVAYDKVIVHPQWSLATCTRIPKDDIALLHLSKPLQFTDKVRSVSLPNPKELQRDLMLVARGTDESGSPSKTMTQMKVKRLTTPECLNYIPSNVRATIRPYVSFLEKAIICGIRPDGLPGACAGDSGSPLVQGGELVGLASFIGHSAEGSNSLQCEKARLGFYTHVASYVPWIKSVTGLQ